MDIKDLLKRSIIYNPVDESFRLTEFNDIETLMICEHLKIKLNKNQKPIEKSYITILYDYKDREEGKLHLKYYVEGKGWRYKNIQKSKSIYNSILGRYL